MDSPRGYKGLVLVVNWVLLLNFVNLSANFYHTDTWNPSAETHLDPIDSLSELVLEFVLDMDDETIPNTEVPDSEGKLKDVKLYWGPGFILKLNVSPQSRQTNGTFLDTTRSAVYLAKISPPPKIFG